MAARVSPFIEDMSEAYLWADLVVCRAGALTISELCVVGLGAVLVPYPHAVDDHQTLNARFMVDAGAARLLPQSQMSPQSLVDVLAPLLAQPERIRQLGDAARKLARPEATEQVVAVCLQTLSEARKA